MKTIIKHSLKQLIDDRYLLVLLIILMLLALIMSINVGLSIKPSELQLVSHYSAFGITHFYSDQWFYLLLFPFFGIVVALFHIVVSIKLLIVKGHPVAIMVAWFGIGIVLLGWATAIAVLNIWTP